MSESCAANGVRFVLSRRSRRLGLPILAAAALAACSRGDSVVNPEPALEAPTLAFQPVFALTDTADESSPLVQLGKILFHDKRLSANESVACSSCHDVAQGGDDGRRVSIGFDGRETAVNAPTVLNSGLNLAQFWDGRAPTLRDQVRQTLVSGIEMGADLQEVMERLRRDDAVVKRFKTAYDDGLTVDNMIDAIASYVGALVTPDSPFDRFLQGDPDAISGDARAGFDLFTGLGCVSCHQGHNFGGNFYERFGVMGDYFSDRGGITKADYGRYNVTGREEDRYRFKVPTLRNIARTAPYFHDGSAATLEDAIETMVEYQLGRTVPQSEVSLLAAFLETLSADVDESLL